MLKVNTSIRTQIQSALGHPIMAGNIDGVDYQCNVAFALAKAHGRRPFDVATKIVAGFKCPLATATAHQSGFINLRLTDVALDHVAKFVVENNALPLAPQAPRTIFFDYGGANIAKELHIGHLRSPIIGEALKRTFKAFGHKTIADTYLGDWGLQMGLVIAQLGDEGFIDGDKFVKPVDLDTFNVLYPRASGRNKTEPEFRERAADITAKLQNKVEPYFTLWQHIRKISVDKIRESYETLGCTFDTYCGESDAAPFVDEVIAKLRTHGAHQSQGCLVLDVAHENETRPMPPVILQKTNGGDLYATSDIATIYYRAKKYHPNQFVYTSDFRQELHMEQVFRTARIGGLVPADTVLTHVSYGTMNGHDGKPFKTRSGDTVKLDDIIKMVTDYALKKMQKPDREVAQKIGLAALKFGDLANTVRKDYVFDIEKFTAFEGKTGPYLLYTIARINSILEKDKTKPTDTAPTREVSTAVVKLADAYTLVTETYSLNPIVDAAYNIANKFNVLYANETIIGNAKNIATARLAHCALEIALDTLAIPTVKEM